MYFQNSNTTIKKESLFKDMVNLNQEKPIVSDVMGTTRDFIEDEVFFGIKFRFVHV